MLFCPNFLIFSPCLEPPCTECVFLTKYDDLLLTASLLQILAAAELLAESGLNSTQHSFLQTVEACGTSLVETVNHVLDFSKLSGNTKSSTIKRTTYVGFAFGFLNLMLVPVSSVALLFLCAQCGHGLSSRRHRFADTVSSLRFGNTDVCVVLVEGCWVGARARAVYGSAGIGSAYSPPKRGVTSPNSDHSSAKSLENSVETILDISPRAEVSCPFSTFEPVLFDEYLPDNNRAGY